MYLEIVSVGEPKLSEKAGKNFRVVRVKQNVIAQFTKADGVRAFAQGVPKTGTIVAWEDRWDNGINDLGFDSKVGDYLMGAVVKRKVIPYTFTDRSGEERTTDSYSTVVLGDVNDESFPLEIDKAFRSNSQEIVETVVVPA